MFPKGALENSRDLNTDHKWVFLDFQKRANGVDDENFLTYKIDQNVEFKQHFC